MEITWYGHSCFRLTERGMASVVTDPFDHRQTGYEAVETARRYCHHQPRQPLRTITWRESRALTTSSPVRENLKLAVSLSPASRPTTARGNDDIPRNTLYVFDYNGLTVAHLGDLNHVPTQTEVEALGTVNMALVPVGVRAA